MITQGGVHKKGALVRKDRLSEEECLIESLPLYDLPLDLAF